MIIHLLWACHCFLFSFVGITTLLTVFCMMCLHQCMLPLPHGSICLLPPCGIICPLPILLVRKFGDSSVANVMKTEHENEGMTFVQKKARAGVECYASWGDHYVSKFSVCRRVKKEQEDRRGEVSEQQQVGANHDKQGNQRKGHDGTKIVDNTKDKKVS